MKLLLFLDVDGVLLGRPEIGSSAYQLANHGLSFLRFVVAEFEVGWATTHCRDGDSRHVVSYIAEHATEEQRDEVVSLAEAIRPTYFNVCKTEIFQVHSGRPWIWIDDAPLQAELEALAQNGWEGRLLRIDTCRAPDDLLRARTELEPVRLLGRGLIQ
jgi:hypothetical protein